MLSLLQESAPVSSQVFYGTNRVYLRSKNVGQLLLFLDREQGKNNQRLLEKHPAMQYVYIQNFTLKLNYMLVDKESKLVHIRNQSYFYNLENYF